MYYRTRLCWFSSFFRIKKKKFKVIGFDNNEKKIKKLKKKFFFSKKIIFTSSKSDIKNSNVYVICVPTPLNDSLEPDTSFIDSAVSTIISVIKNGDLIIFESTCYPGCTKEMVVDRIEREKKLKFKKNFFVTYSPERIDPANKKFKIKDIPKVIGSECKKSLKLTDDIYKKIFKKTYILHKFEEAELAKLIENVFRQVNIGLINEMAMMCGKITNQYLEFNQSVKHQAIWLYAIFSWPRYRRSLYSSRSNLFELESKIKKFFF